MLIKDNLKNVNSYKKTILWTDALPHPPKKNKNKCVIENFKLLILVIVEILF